MLKFIHLSDIHLVERGLYTGYDTRAIFSRALEHIVQEHSDADFIALTGDLASWGEKAAYEWLREKLAALPLRSEMIIGNHDHRATFLSIFGHDYPYEQPYVHYWRDTDSHRLIFLDTVTEGTHGGDLDTPRLTWLQQTLASSTKPALLFMHHQPLVLGAPALDAKGLADTAPLRALLRQYKEQIAHIFHGHCHCPVQGHVEGVSFSGIRSLGPQAMPDLHHDKVRLVVGAPHYAVVFADQHSLVSHPIEFDYTGPVTLRSRQIFADFRQQCAERGVTRLAGTN